MSAFEDRIMQMMYINELIEKRKSGSYREIAETLNMSKSNVVRLMETLRGLGADIVWDEDLHTYYYSNNFTFHLELKKRPVSHGTIG